MSKPKKYSLRNLQTDQVLLKSIFNVSFKIERAKNCAGCSGLKETVPCSFLT